MPIGRKKKISAPFYGILEKKLEGWLLFTKFFRDFLKFFETKIELLVQNHLNIKFFNSKK